MMNNVALRDALKRGGKMISDLLGFSEAILDKSKQGMKRAHSGLATQQSFQINGRKKPPE